MIRYKVVLTHEKIQHNVCNDHVESAEVYKGGGEVAAVSLPVVVSRGAVGWSHHAVMHDLVPVFSRHDAKQHRHAVDRRIEVGPPFKYKHFHVFL